MTRETRHSDDVCRNQLVEPALIDLCEFSAEPYARVVDEYVEIKAMMGEQGVKPCWCIRFAHVKRLANYSRLWKEASQLIGGVAKHVHRPGEQNVQASFLQAG